MPNRLTQVPDVPVPRLPTWMGPVLLAADWFMVMMISRPSEGSLKSVWVTPATIQLCAALDAVTVPVALVVVAGAIESGGWIPILIAAGMLAVALGSMAVLTVGVAQRHLTASVR